jgi:Abnormal spindle-like microcephaly-assoc'd, ASPM-SPD-2-Hydin
VKLTISPTSLSFGSVKTGGAPIKSVTLHNKGKTVDAIAVPLVTGQNFSLASNTCGTPVPAGGTCQIGVSFAPLAAGKFTGNLMFTDQSKKSGHKINLKGKGVRTPATTPTATPSVAATATATPTVTSTGGPTPTATATVTATMGTPTPTSTSTAAYTLTSISETVSGFVDLSNPNAAPNPVQTMQAVAISTPSFTDSISVSDTNVSVSGSASASQTSQAEGSTISANESAAADADLSLCVGPSLLCTAADQGITEFKADFCIASTATYSLTGSVQASASEDLGNITAAGFVSIESLGTSMFLVNEQATNGQNVPISMSVALPAGCYEMIVEVFAQAFPSGTGAGSASASGNVQLSP